MPLGYVAGWDHGFHGRSEATSEVRGGGLREKMDWERLFVPAGAYQAG